MLTPCSRDVLTLAGTAWDGCLWGSPKRPVDGLVSGRVNTQRNGAQMTHNPEGSPAAAPPSRLADEASGHRGRASPFGRRAPAFS
jgi:hypothetical protein